MRKTKLLFTMVLAVVLSGCDDDTLQPCDYQELPLTADATESCTDNDCYMQEEIVISTDVIIRDKEVESTFPTRSITRVYDGTANGTPKKTYSNQKVIINNVTGVSTGVYFADVYTTSGTIDLPDGATDVNFDLPDVCGYVDWTTREEGVIKSTIQYKDSGKNKRRIKWSFYTLVLRYNAAGASMNKALPKDGAKIYLPYNFVY